MDSYVNCISKQVNLILTKDTELENQNLSLASRTVNSPKKARKKYANFEKWVTNLEMSWIATFEIHIQTKNIFLMKYRAKSGILLEDFAESAWTRRNTTRYPFPEHDHEFCLNSE